MYIWLDPFSHFRFFIWIICTFLVSSVTFLSMLLSKVLKVLGTFIHSSSFSSSSLLGLCAHLSFIIASISGSTAMLSRYPSVTKSNVRACSSMYFYPISFLAISLCLKNVRHFLLLCDGFTSKSSNSSDSCMASSILSSSMHETLKF
jgi:hypothetical protein